MLILFNFYSFFFFWSCFVVFTLANLFWLKRKNSIWVGSSLETGQDLLVLITLPFKLVSWAGFVLEQFLLDCFLSVFPVRCISVTKFLSFKSSPFVTPFGLLTHPFKGWYLQPKYQGSAFQLVTPFNLVMDRHPVDNINFNLISLNVWGIRDFAKRKAIFSWIKKQNADIAFLQETYSPPDFVEKWRFQLPCR